MKTLFILLFVVALVACGKPEPTPAPTVPQQVTPADTTPRHSPETVVIQPPQGSDSHNVSDNDSTAGVKPIRPVVYAHPSYNGPTSIEERIADADLVIIGRMLTVENRVEEANLYGQTGYVGALHFTFDVQEVLMSPAGSTAPTRVVALVPTLNRVDTRAQALQISQRMLSERDTQWDDRNAIIFLSNFNLRYPATQSDDLYFMSIIDYETGFDDHYSLASRRNRMWLPEARPHSGGGGGDDGTGGATGAVLLRYSVSICYSLPIILTRGYPNGGGGMGHSVLSCFGWGHTRRHS